MALVYCIDPSTHSVAPFGAVTPVFTPNPLAAGIPTSGDPILLDISASYTTNGMTARLHKAGESLAAPVGAGCARQCRRAIPRVLFDEPKGHAAAARRARSRAQGVRARAAGRGADGGTRGPRPRRSAGRLGRDGVRAGARSRRHSAAPRRSRADGLAGRAPATTRRRGPADRACDCRASARSHVIASSARTASRSTRRSCRRSSRGRKSLPSPYPRKWRRSRDEPAKWRPRRPRYPVTASTRFHAAPSSDRRACGARPLSCPTCHGSA